MTAAGENWVVLASLVRPQGRRGEMLAELLTDFPESLSGRELLLRRANDLVETNFRQVRVESYWRHKGRVVLKFAGVDSMNAAEELRGMELVVPFSARMPPGEDAVYISDLIGARIIDVSQGDARDAGEILNVQLAGEEPAMLVVNAPQHAEPVLIPFAKAYLRRIDLAAKRLEMVLPEGLLDVDAPVGAEERDAPGEEFSA